MDVSHGRPTGIYASCVQNTYIGQAMGLFGIVLVLLLASRAVFLFPILAVHNFFCAEKLPFRHTVVAW